MKTLPHNTPAKVRKTGRYRSVDEAVQHKQTALLTILAGANLTRLSDSTNVEKRPSQPADDNVSDVPYEEMR